MRLGERAFAFGVGRKCGDRFRHDFHVIAQKHQPERLVVDRGAVGGVNSFYDRHFRALTVFGSQLRLQK